MHNRVKKKKSLYTIWVEFVDDEKNGVAVDYKWQNK